MTIPVPRAIPATAVARAACACAAALVLAACTPALDWRELRPAGTSLALLMPCRPVLNERTLGLAGAQVRLALHACSAGGQTWGLAHADVEDPARVGPALTELGSAAAANIATRSTEVLPLAVPGATPQPDARRVRLEGVLPDGRAVQMQTAVFALGTRVFQATSLGERLPMEAAQTFFESMRIPP